MLIERDFRLRMAADARRVAALALEEDGLDDVTSMLTVSPRQTGMAVVEARGPGILAGTTYADAVAVEVGLPPVTWVQPAGTAMMATTVLGTLSGEIPRILRAERAMLNLLQRAIGIATLTREFVDAVAGTGAKILHTRKTAPGLRLLDVSAVLAGGGHLHRLDLGTQVMVKDNHWRALERSGRSLADALTAARTLGTSGLYVEVETESQVEMACAAGATRLVIDNQSPETVQIWAARARAKVPGIEIEATGGISLANARAYAAAGADFLSIGALTHSPRAGDVAMEIKE